MRSYCMGMGANELLVDFKDKDDFDARQHAMKHNAEYCVRTKGYKGASKYTVLDLNWNKECE